MTQPSSPARNRRRDGVVPGASSDTDHRSAASNPAADGEDGDAAAVPPAENGRDANADGGDGGIGNAGYTPFDDLDLTSAVAYAGGAVVNPNEDDGDGGAVMFSFGAPGGEVAGWSDDDDDEGEGDGRGRVEGGLGEEGGAFYVNSAAFGGPPHPRYQNGGMNGGPMNGANGDMRGEAPRAEPDRGDAQDPALANAGAEGGNGVGNDDGEVDFLALADRALRALDDEYTATVRAGGNAVVVADPASAEPPAGPEANGEENAETERPSVEGYDPLPEVVASEPPSAAAGGDGGVTGNVGEGASSLRSADSSTGDDSTETAAPKSSSLPLSEPAVTPADDSQLDLFADAAAPPPPPPPATPRELPPVDASAVLRAVSSIRLKAPSLASNLDNYTPSDPRVARTARRLAVPKSHPIIPEAPLKAWRKETRKAAEATSNLSRSGTLAEAVRRCLPGVLDPSSAEGRDKLTIHILGCDHVECISSDAIRAAFGPFVRWMGALSRRPREIALVLVGPNVGEGAERRGAVNLLPPASAAVGSAGKKGRRLEKAEVRCHDALYHEYLGDASSDDSFLSPDLIVAYNAGIWGYDSWLPTLEYLCRKLPRPTPAVVTGYTLQEVEDDAEVVEEVLRRCCHPGEGNGTGGAIEGAARSEKKSDGANAADDDKEWLRARCLWSPELNPFGSRKRRETATAPAEEGGSGGDGRREYRENGAWQAWRFGRAGSDVGAASEP